MSLNSIIEIASYWIIYVFLKIHKKHGGFFACVTRGGMKKNSSMCKESLNN